MRKKKDTAAIKSYLDLLSDLEKSQMEKEKIKEGGRGGTFTQVNKKQPGVT